MATAPHAPAPFIAPVAGDLDQRLTQVAQALNRKADATSEPSFSAIILRAPNGASWRLSVSNTGALSTAVVP